MKSFFKDTLLPNVLDIQNIVSFIWTIFIFSSGIWQNLSLPTISIIILGGITCIAVLSKMYRAHELKFPRMDKREDRTYNVLETYFSKKGIRLIDFISTDNPRIQRKIFEDCIIEGPCVININGNGSCTDCSFIAGGAKGVDDLLIEVNNKRLFGIVGFENCTFNRCTFINISLIGMPELINAFRKNTNMNNC